jgi:hypothetical protein
VKENALKSRHVTRNVHGARLTPTAGTKPGERGRPLSLLLGQIERIALALGDRVDDAHDQLGQLARDALGRQFADLVERSALDQTDEPLLGKLVPRALKAREWTPDGRHLGRSYPWKRRTGPDFGRRLRP